MAQIKTRIKKFANYVIRNFDWNPGIFFTAAIVGAVMYLVILDNKFPLAIQVAILAVFPAMVTDEKYGLNGTICAALGEIPGVILTIGVFGPPLGYAFLPLFQVAMEAIFAAAILTVVLLVIWEKILNSVGSTTNSLFYSSY